MEIDVVDFLKKENAFLNTFSSYEPTKKDHMEETYHKLLFYFKNDAVANKLFTLSKTYLESSTVRNRDTERSFIIDTIQFYEKASEIFPKDDDEWEEVIRLSSEINQKYKKLNPDKDHPEYFNSYITTTLIVLLDVIQKQVKGGH